MTATYKTPPTAKAMNRWTLADLDGTTLAIQDWVTGDEALLEWDDEAAGWMCSECGLQTAPRRTQAVVTCVHVTSGLRHLPVETAVEIGCDLIKRRKGKTVAERTPMVDIAAIEEARGAIARAEGKAVREKYADRDAHHREIASTVVVRQMTDDDRAKLEARRAKKARSYAFD